MIEHRSTGDKIFNVFNCIFLVLLAVACAYPLVHVISGSFSDPVELGKHIGPLLGPVGFSLDGYKVVLENPNVWNGYANTLFYVIVGTAARLLMTMLGGYVLSRKEFMLRTPMMLMIVFTMYFSGGLIPEYLLNNALGLVNTRAAIIVPTLINTWNMIIMKTAFQTIPESLEESAKLDGASHLCILFRIMMPLCKATISVLMLYYAVAEWNSWFTAAVYLPSKNDLHPLQLVLRNILINYETGGNVNSSAGEVSLADLFLDDVVRYCTICVATIPILCLYPFIQKYFEKGVMMGSVKG